MDTFDSGVCHGAPFCRSTTAASSCSTVATRRWTTWNRPAEVERTDFIGVNVREIATRRRSSTAATLDLERNPLSSDAWPEFDAGNVGFVLSTPEQKGGGEYTPEYSIAFRVADVGGSMEGLRERGVDFEFPEVYDSGVSPHGVLQRSRRKRADAPPPLRAVQRRFDSMQVECVDFVSFLTKDIATRHGCLSHGFLPRPGRQRAHAPSALRPDRGAGRARAGRTG